MAREVAISIIICTHNGGQRLLETLASLGKVEIRPNWQTEVIVVDNASTDDTATIVRNATLRNMTLRYVYEPNKGLSNARNAGLANAGGAVILFTDDDVLVAKDWVEQMATPLMNGECEAVSGQFTLAPHLIRTWMSPMHKSWLASSSEIQAHDAPRELIGGNMGFRRSILERGLAFDPELGAGALGFAEETLFGRQLSQAGFRIQYAPKALAIHHLDVSRLQRKHWLKDARKRGQTRAYVCYHWEHADIRFPRLVWFSYWVRLQLRRVVQKPPPAEIEGCPQWEMSYVMNMEKCRQYCVERRRPRNYLRWGLTKRSV